jgi:DNA-binding beta-propeller fold protein YncE
MPDSRHGTPTDHERLARYWDDLSRGQISGDAALDADLVATIRRFHEIAGRDSSRGPDPRFVDRLLEELMATPSQPLQASRFSFAEPVGSLNGKTALPSPSQWQIPASRRGRWALAQLATAALVLLTLAGSFMVFGPGRLGWQQEPPSYVPAVVATPGTPEAVKAPVAEFLWESSGPTGTPFREPNHPVVDPRGNVWVPDGWNSHFVIYAPDGRLLETWGTKGSGEGEFLFENGGIGFAGVAFDGNGNMYVADSGNHRIQKFGPDRTFVAAWGSKGSERGQFRQPVALVVDAGGRVYVSDRGQGSVEVFDSDGAWLQRWDGLGKPVGIAIDRDGTIWLADEGLGQVIQFGPNGERLQTWIMYGGGDGELLSPSGVAVDGQGRIFVSDRGNRVQIFAPTQIFSSEPMYLASWDGSDGDSTSFNGPYGVAVDDQGQVYVAEDYGLQLQAFQLLPPFAPVSESTVMATPEVGVAAPVAELLWQSEGDPELPLGDPNNLAIDPQGNLWVTDGRNNRFQIFAPDGAFLEAWGTPGEGEGELDFVEPGLFGGYGAGSMAFDAAGNLYVVDPGNYRIQVFGPDRGFVTAWGSKGSEDGQFLAALDLAVDGQGQVYVVDETRGDIQLFDRDGHFLSNWSATAEDWPGKPSGITIDGEGTLWINFFQLDTVRRYAADGSLLTSWDEFGSEQGQFNSPSGVSIDDQGRVYVNEWANNRIQVFDGDGTFLATWGHLGRRDDGFSFSGLNGSVLDGQGNIYVVQDGTDQIKKFRLLPPLAPAGTTAATAPAVAERQVAQFVWETEGGPGMPFHDPTALAFDPDGNLWVPDGNNGRFQIFTPDGALLENWGTPGSAEGEFNLSYGAYGYGAVAWDAEGNVYVADTGNFRIQKFSPDGGIVTAWGSRGDGDGQFLGLTYLFLDRDGRLHAVDHERDDIQVFDTDGNYLGVWGGTGTGSGRFDNPGSIAQDAAGNFYVTEYLNHRVQKFSPDGVPMAIFGEEGRGAGQFINPTDVMVDGAGRVFVADYGNHRIQIFDADGRYVASFGELGFKPGQFVNPIFMVLDGQGAIYVSDEGSDRVQKFRLLPPLSPE